LRYKYNWSVFFTYCFTPRRKQTHKRSCRE